MGEAAHGRRHRRWWLRLGIATGAGLSIGAGGWLWLQSSDADDPTATSNAQRRGAWLSGKECFTEALGMQVECSKQRFWKQSGCRQRAQRFVRACLAASLHAGEVCLPPQKPVQLCNDAGDVSDDCLTLAEGALEACRSFPEAPLTCRQKGASSDCLALEATARDEAKLCDLEPSTQGRDDCIQAVAEQKLRPNLCAAGLPPLRTLECYERVFRKLEGPEACQALDFPALEDRCLERVLAKSTNREDCARLRDLESAGRCYLRAAHAAQDPAPCANVVLPEQRDWCYAKLGKCDAVQRRELFPECRAPVRLQECEPTPSSLSPLEFGFSGEMSERFPGRGPDDCWRRSVLDVIQAAGSPLNATQVAQVCDPLAPEHRARCVEEFISVNGDGALCELERDPFLRMRCRAKRSSINPCQGLSDRYLPYCVTTYLNKLDDPRLCQHALNVTRRAQCVQKLQR